MSGFSCLAHADKFVHGHFKSNGTYVEPYYQSSPDSTKLNNFSTQGNINPYTYQLGTVNPYSEPEPYQLKPTRRR